MKKVLIGLILAILMLSLVACDGGNFESDWSSDATTHWHASTSNNDKKADVANHTFVANGSDANGNTLYVCSVCEYEHQHSYSVSEWDMNGRHHWRPATCGHSDAPIFREEHSFDTDGVCSVCGGDESKLDDGYEVAFAYYVVDENGAPVVDESTGAYIEVGVTYTSVQKGASTQIDTINGGVLYEGDTISFTVEKSVFCEYTDKTNQALVEVISGESGKTTVEEVYPDENGIYTVTIESDTIISVANVETSPCTITGDGTKDNPFAINSLVDWLYFAMYVNDKSYYSLEYNIGYWKLNTDLDFEGESIYVIGDGYSSGNSVFCGNFDGGGHTISNFVLDNTLSSTVGTGYSNYLGLFGVSTGYVGVDSVISNLTVENATINATAASDDLVSAGAILGYGVGANIVNCTARNVQINVVADDMYMSFAGGIVGYLQSGMTDEGMLFYSSVSYSVADEVTIKGSGMLYSAGGIAGRVMSYSEQVTAFIINSYSTNCDIADATRAGGIAGDVQRFGSIQNCYSTSSVSAYATINTAVDNQFVGTVYDDRFAYAGGIVGYVENDTAVTGCFFDGRVYSGALAGSSYAKKGNIVAGYSAPKFADFNANSVVLDNQADGVIVDNAYIQDTLKWSVADWTFGDGYPTINQTETPLTFEVKINVDGVDKHTISIDSQYIPLSYWYILEGVSFDTIARYYSDGSNRTYGYYFDSALTKAVPVGYVPMGNITLYTGYADTSEIEGEYFVSNGGVMADIVISTDGTYTYQEGAIYLVGNYKYDGETITFESSFFSRLATSATANQKASYYTFWATVQANGDLHLYDCDEIYTVTEENEEQNATFTAMARFYPVSDPLEIISSSNLSFTGGYYYLDGTIKHVFNFNNDFTGTYKRYNGAVSDISDKFEISTNGSTIVITLEENGTEFVATADGGVLTSIENNRGASFTLSQIDSFVGTWEKSATTHKLYTFDGMGNWSYEHYFYLNNDSLANATKQVVESESGTYTLDDGNLKLTRNGISVVASIKDGNIVVTENGQPVEVEFAGKNSYMGVWYTASNKIVRYTLTLEGLNSKGVGMATLDGFNTAPLELRYLAVSDTVLYLYANDVVYAVLEYSAKTGLMEGLFYDSSTASTTTLQTLYLYDDFKGAWVSDIADLKKVSFNGYGAYNTTDATGNSLAVKGIVTIDGASTTYTINQETGMAEFTYKTVKYTLKYNEYANTISVTYAGGSGIIAKADDYVNVVLYGNGTTYTFDGRGQLSGGGTLVANDTAGTYTILANGNVEMTIAGETKTIVVSATGYTLDGSPLYVDNAFSGVWAIADKHISVEVGNFELLPKSGQTIEIAGTFNGESVTMYFNGIDTMSFEAGASKYSLTQVLQGKASALLFTKFIGDEVVYEATAVKQDDFFGVWTKSSNEKLTFDGAGASPYVNGGTVKEQKPGLFTDYTYKIVEGVVTIFNEDGTVYKTFVECESTDQDAYVNEDRYYKLV